MAHVEEKQIPHKAWAAGLFDGEGTIGVHLSGDKKGGLRRKICISMIYRPALELFHNTYGGHLFKHNASSKAYPSFRCWKWEISHKDQIKAFLVDVLPFLTEKKSQAEIMIKQIDGELSMQEARELLRYEKEQNKIRFVVWPS
jgi:predicted CopG family antitoxin